MPANVAVQPNGQAMMAYAGEDQAEARPWWDGQDGLFGVYVKGKAMTWEQAVALAGLGWWVRTLSTEAIVPVIDAYGQPVLDADGQQLVERRPLRMRAVQRCDTGDILSEGRSPEFRLVQNEELFRWFDGIVGLGGAIYNTVGALGRGERVWVLAEIPGDCIVGGVDRIKKYVLIANGHDGSLAFSINWVGTRVVCENTLRAALGEASQSVKIRHRQNWELRAEEAKATLGVINKHWQDTEVLFNQMARVPVTDGLAADLFAKVFELPGGTSESAEARRKQAEDQRVRALDLFHTGLGQAQLPGTAWAAYNAVTQMTTHDFGRRKADAQMNYTLWGQGSAYQARTLELCAALVR